MMDNYTERTKFSRNRILNFEVCPIFRNIGLEQTQLESGQKKYLVTQFFFLLPSNSVESEGEVNSVCHTDLLGRRVD